MNILFYNGLTNSINVKDSDGWLLKYLKNNSPIVKSLGDILKYVQYKDIVEDDKVDIFYDYQAHKYRDAHASGEPYKHISTYGADGLKDKLNKVVTFWYEGGTHSGWRVITLETYDKKHIQGTEKTGDGKYKNYLRSKVSELKVLE